MKPRCFIKIHIFNDFPQISTMKIFNFRLFGFLRGSILRFDGSSLLYLIFYSNLSGRGESGETGNHLDSQFLSPVMRQTPFRHTHFPSYGRCPANHGIYLENINISPVSKSKISDLCPLKTKIPCGRVKVSR